MSLVRSILANGKSKEQEFNFEWLKMCIFEKLVLQTSTIKKYFISSQKPKIFPKIGILRKWPTPVEDLSYFNKIGIHRVLTDNRQTDTK